MGAGSSHLGSRHSRLLRPHRPKRSCLSSLLLCGGSTPLTARTQMEDDPSELLVNSMKHSEPVVNELRSPSKESSLASDARTGLVRPRPETETGASSEIIMVASEDSSFEDGLVNVETNNQGKCLSESKELVPRHQLSSDYRNNDTASTSYEDRSFSDSVSANVRSTMDAVDNMMDKDESQISSDVIHAHGSSPQELPQELEDFYSDEVSVENHVSEWIAVPSSDSGSGSVDSNSQVTSQLLTDDTLRESIPPGLGFIVSDRERGRGVGSVLHVDVVWGRLHSGHERDNHRTSICPLGLYPDGTCLCESILTAEESGTRASISRIVMLAEALFEVLDEIHQQPLSLSASAVSLPASEAVVDSFPVQYYGKPGTTENGDDVARCYICLSEYEEGDKIRVLPCQHDFHLSCVDKWLKEIHGVCPLCRKDVGGGFTEGSVSNSEIPLFG